MVAAGRHYVQLGSQVSKKTSFRVSRYDMILLKKSDSKNEENIFRSQMLYNARSELG